MKDTYHFAFPAILGLTTIMFADLAVAECSSRHAQSGANKQYSLDGDMVIDNATGFVWARCSVGQRLSEGSAKCTGTVAKLTYDDATKAKWPAGWRLPKADELKTIVVADCENPSIDSEVFPGTAPDPYWAVDDEGCWIVNFGPGTTYGPNSYLCGYGGLSAVRLVRE